MIFDIQLFGGRGATSGNNKTITIKGSKGEKETIKLNGEYLLDLKDIGLEKIRGKEFDNRVDMFNYLQTQLPKSASLDRRTSQIIYDTGKPVNSWGNTYSRYDVITWKNKETKKIGISYVLGGSYKKKNGIYTAIRYF